MKKAVLLDFTMKGVIFVLITASIVLSVLYSLRIPFPIWQTILLIISMYFILSLYLWNVWTSLLLFPATIVSALLYARNYMSEDWHLDMFSRIDQMANYIRGYGVLEPQNLFFLGILVLVLFSFVFYALVILLERLFPALIAGGTIIGILWYIGHFSILSFVWLFVLGVILLISEKQRQNVSKGNQTPNYGRWHLSTLPFAVVVTMTAFAVLPSDTSNLRWHLIEDAALEVNETLWDWFTFDDPRSGFRLWQTGFAPTTGRLGGPVTLNHEVALHVESPERVLLRGAVLNFYTGYGWNDTVDNRAHSFVDAQDDHLKDLAFDRFEAIQMTGEPEAESEIFERFNITIQHTGIVTSVIFNASKLNNAYFAGDEMDVYFSAAGETFTKANISADASYTLEVFVPDKQSEAFRQKFEQWPAINWSQPISRDLSSEWGLNHRKLLHVQRYYTPIPETVTERVIELTNDVVSEAETPFEKALAIESFLKNNFGYTLRPPHAPQDVDFVDHFLFDLRVGYCTYFATAFAVMGRIAGLPTRYVEGFLMPLTPVEGELFEIRQSNAHAWVEVYFPGIGWLTFDPTPPIEAYFAQHEYIPGVSGDLMYAEYMDPYWQFIHGVWMSGPPGAGVTPGTFPPLEETQETEMYQMFPNPMVFALIFAGIILFAAVSLFIILLIIQKYRQIKRGKMPYRLRMKAYIKEILWLLSLYQYPVMKGETPYTYAQRVDSWLVNEAGSMMDVTGLLVKSEFGHHQLTEQDLDLMEKFHKNLETSTKYVLGRFRFYAVLAKVIVARQ